MNLDLNLWKPENEKLMHSCPTDLILLPLPSSTPELAIGIENKMKKGANLLNQKQQKWGLTNKIHQETDKCHQVIASVIGENQGTISFEDQLNIYRLNLRFDSDSLWKGEI